MWKYLFLLFFFPVTAHAIWPLSWEFNNEKRYLGNLISYNKQDNNTRLVISPLLFSYESTDGGVYNYLYPLGRITKDRSYFVPFYMSKGDEENNDSSFIFIFRGKSQKGSYFGFFPFFGKLYDRFGRDEMGFFMWPLYSYTEKDGSTKHNILWPFFSVYSGNTGGFKAWPLVGYREQKGVRKTGFFLWPFFAKDDRNLDTDDPIRSLYAVPFYLRSENDSKTRTARYIMFPFYTHTQNPDREKWDILWPFFSFTKGKETEGYSIFPLVYNERKEKDKMFGFLWPFGYHESVYYAKEERFVRKRILLLNRYIEDEEGIFYNVWPFLEVRKKGGTTKTGILSPVPLKALDADKIIKPLFSLYERVENDDKISANILQGFLATENDGENYKTRLAFIVECKKENGKSGFEFLSGLFGIDSEKIKIFYIPFSRKTPKEVDGEAK